MPLSHRCSHIVAPLPSLLPQLHHCRCVIAVASLLSRHCCRVIAVASLLLCNRPFMQLSPCSRTSHRAIIAAPMPSCHLCHCRSSVVVIGHQCFVHRMSSLTWLHCRCAVDQCLSSMSSLSLSLSRVAVMPTIVRRRCRHCHFCILDMPPIPLSLPRRRCAHACHLQMLLVLKNNIAHKGRRPPCPFYQQMDPSYLDHSLTLCCTAECECHIAI